MSDEAKRLAVETRYPRGSTVKGKVSRHMSFGIFLDIEGIPCPCIVEIVSFKYRERMTPEEFPSIGSKVKAVVFGYNQKPLWQCKLDMRPFFDAESSEPDV